MTEHAGLPVKGYQPQTDDKISKVNRLKELEETFLREIDSLAKDPEVDGRWLAIGRTHIQQGTMAAARAVFQPSRINLPGDTLA